MKKLNKRQRKSRMEQLERKAYQAANMAWLNQEAGRKEEAVVLGEKASFYMEARMALRKNKPEPEYKEQTTLRGAALRSARRWDMHEEDDAIELHFA